MSRALVLATFIIGIVANVIIQIPPEDVISNASKWLIAFGINPPKWIDNKNTNLIIRRFTWALIAGCLIYLVWPIGLWIGNKFWTQPVRVSQAVEIAKPITLPQPKTIKPKKDSKSLERIDDNLLDDFRFEIDNNMRLSNKILELEQALISNNTRILGKYLTKSHADVLVYVKSKKLKSIIKATKINMETATDALKFLEDHSDYGSDNRKNGVAFLVDTVKSIQKNEQFLSPINVFEVDDGKIIFADQE